MEMLAILIVAGFGLILWEIKSSHDRLVDQLDDVQDEVEAVKLELAYMDETYDEDEDGHSEITCDLCGSSQCLECDGRECENCGMMIRSPAAPTADD